MEVTWVDIEDSINDCVTICKKNNLTIFRIMKSKYGFYADYFDNRLFESPSLTYYEAAQIAKNKMDNDTLNNRLLVAKEFFLENYKDQIFNTIFKLQRMSI